MYRIFALFLALTLFFALGTTAFARTGIQIVDENSKIDWTNNAFIATGEGAMQSAKEEPNRARAYLKAKTYARMAAIANLMMAAEGTVVDYEANGRDFSATESVQQKIKGMARAVQVVDTRKEQVEGGTIVVVKVRAPMPREIKEQAAVPPVKKTAKVVKAYAPDAYTSLIVDARGCGLTRSMSPKIRTSDGREVWGTVKADYDFVEEHGIVAYTQSMREARDNNRCGSNPLIVKATRAVGPLRSDPVISERDADLIISENQKGGFMEDFKVIFIKN